MEFIPLIIKQLPTVLSISAIILVFFFYKFTIYILDETAFIHIYTYLSNK